MLLTDEDIIDALRLNPNRERWTKADWDAQITKEHRQVAKAQLKQAVEKIPTWFVDSLVLVNKEGKLPVGSGGVIEFMQALLKEIE